MSLEPSLDRVLVDEEAVLVRVTRKVVADLANSSESREREIVSACGGFERVEWTGREREADLLTDGVVHAGRAVQLVRECAEQTVAIWSTRARENKMSVAKERARDTTRRTSEDVGRVEVRLFELRGEDLFLDLGVLDQLRGSGRACNSSQRIRSRL